MMLYIELQCKFHNLNEYTNICDIVKSEILRIQDCAMQVVCYRGYTHYFAQQMLTYLVVYVFWQSV